MYDRSSHPLGVQALEALALQINNAVARETFVWNFDLENNDPHIMSGSFLVEPDPTLPPISEETVFAMCLTISSLRYVSRVTYRDNRYVQIDVQAPS